jgi:hypothetical protein
MHDHGRLDSCSGWSNHGCLGGGTAGSFCLRHKYSVRIQSQMAIGEGWALRSRESRGGGHSIAQGQLCERDGFGAIKDFQ